MNKLIAKAQVAFDAFKKSEAGAALVEYSLLIGLITVLVVAAVFGIGTWAQTQWTSLCTAVSATCT